MGPGMGSTSYSNFRSNVPREHSAFYKAGGEAIIRKINLLNYLYR